VPKKQYIVADALLQRPRHSKDTRSSKEEEDINNWILSKLRAYEICPIGLKDDQSSKEDPKLQNKRQIL
jgi:hypothetical protein